MRCNVAIYGLWACSIGSSAAGVQNQGFTGNLAFTFDGPPTFKTSDTPKFYTWHSYPQVKINVVWLKSYTLGFANNDSGNAVIGDASNEQIWNKTGFIQHSGQNRVDFHWDLLNSTDYLEKALYLEGEWTNDKGSSGNSTSPLFAVYDNGDQMGYAQNNLSNAQNDLNNARPGGGGAIAPAYTETTQSLSLITSASTSTTSISSRINPTQTSGTTTLTTSATSASLITTATAPAADGLPARRSGLSRAGVIGIAVGASLGGLLIAGALLWFFWLRRRRPNNTPRHAMTGYDSDMDAHAIVTDKEIPALLETPAPGSAYGGEGRPSTDHYTPYSDRPIASPVPTPHRHRAASSEAAEAPATSQTDLTWTREAQTPTPVPAITSRYAHLIDDGMTEEEVRRVEEEERQLDAAIENAGIEKAGRRRNS